MMKPEWCPQEFWDTARKIAISLNGFAQPDDFQRIARALLDAHQRGKDENQAEIDRLNKVIARMQQTMSSQAEQWTRSMAEARREGMEEAAKVAGEEWRRWQNEPGSQIDTLDRASCRAIAAAIRAKAQEVKT